MNGLFQWISICALMLVGDAAIEPPPWGDPSKNPCANKPGGWQLLYWPPLKQCFKIYTVSTQEIQVFLGISSKLHARYMHTQWKIFFLILICQQLGYPCPETMELTPGSNSRISTGLAAECRCPPGTAQHHDSTSCYKLYEQGPCDIGQYFAPANEPSNSAIMYVWYGVQYLLIVWPWKNAYC